MACMKCYQIDQYQFIVLAIRIPMMGFLSLIVICKDRSELEYRYRPLTSVIGILVISSISYHIDTSRLLTYCNVRVI